MIEQPVELGLPERFLFWRPGQAEVIEEIAQSGAKHFLLDAPTGAGKSLVAIATYKKMQVAWAVMDRLLDNEPPRRRCVYVTKTKQLQDQVLREFPESRTMRGRNNYPCLLKEKDFPEFTAEHCPGSKKCSRSEACPYLIDKQIALRAPIAVLNEAYYLAEINGPGQFSDAEFVVLDEIDGVESSLMGFIQFTVSTQQLERFKLALPENTSSLASWRAWADHAAFLLAGRGTSIQGQLDAVDMEDWSPAEMELQKQSKRVETFKGKLFQFVNAVNENWIMTEERSRGEYRWTFKPVLVAEYADRALWRHGRRFLGMSGTIFDPEILAHDIGLADYSYRRLDSTFPVEHRPIYFERRADGSLQELCYLTYQTKDRELPRLAKQITEILAMYPNQKCLIHTVSYSTRDYLMAALPPDRLVTHDSTNREDRLHYFKTSTHPLVMVSPSFDRGVDLRDDDCRCVIICKVPYLDLSDLQVKKRMAMPDGQRWYCLKAAQTIVQMSGRAVRGPEDWADTWILDRNFSKLKFQMRNILPRWWLEAIK